MINLIASDMRDRDKDFDIRNNFNRKLKIKSINF